MIEDTASRVLAEAEGAALLTVQEYALIFRRHPQTIYKAIYRGTLPYPVVRPTGHQVLIRVPERVIADLKRAS